MTQPKSTNLLLFTAGCVAMPILPLHIIRETHSALLSGPSAHQILQVLDRRLRGRKCRRPEIGSNLVFWGGSESGAKTHVPAPIHINSLEIDTEKTMRDCEQIKNVENE